MDTFKLIPYGVSSFVDIRTRDMYYVDKTMFIPEIEEISFAFLLRPRRFGKSLFTAMLHAYYDINYANRFDELFSGLWIHEHPTRDRGKYFCLRFDFSGIDKEDENVQSAFNKYCMHCINTFTDDYEGVLPLSVIEKIREAKTSYDKLLVIEREFGKLGHKLYILIDEYDNFTNTLLTDQGHKLYEQMTKGSGFFKAFFTNLKKMTSGNSNVLQRLYITGVSPITMDDVASGFNIGTNISLIPRFSNMLGFSENDVSEMIDYYKSTGRLTLCKDELIFELKKWYDEYRFYEKATESTFNSTGVLSVMYYSLDSDTLPTIIIDENLRMDSKKLQHLVYEGTNLNGNFNALSEIISNGGIECNINKSFPFKMLKQTENYISLIFFLGFLTFSGKTKKGKPFLCIPNETIMNLVYEYILSILKESIRIDDWFFELDKLCGYLAYDGDFKPVFNFIAKLINQQTSIRDFKEGEEIIKTFHNVYLRINTIYYTKTEFEMNKGYADIVLFPNYSQYPDIKYAYLIEVKYIKRDIKAEMLPEEIEQKINIAKKQLEQYTEDHPSRQEYHLKPNGTVELKKLIVVYHGWEMVYCEEWSSEFGIRNYEK